MKDYGKQMYGPLLLSKDAEGQWIDSRIYNNLDSAVSDIGGESKTLYVGENSTLSNIGNANLTIWIPKGITVTVETAISIESSFLIEDGGQLKIDENVTINGNIESKGYRSDVVALEGTTSENLTINGFITAGLWKIFGDNLNISDFTNISSVYVEWFGALGDGSTDDSTAIQNTVDAIELSSKRPKILLAAKDYLVGTGIDISKTGVVIEGVHSGYQESGTGLGNTRIITNSSLGEAVIDIGVSTTVFGVILRNFGIYGNAQNNGVRLFDNVSNCKFENLYLDECKVCFRLETSCFNNVFSGCVVYDFEVAGWYLYDKDHHTTLRECKSWGCSTKSPNYSVYAGISDRIASLNLINCDFEAWNVTYQVYARNIDQCYISGCYMEAKDATTVRIIFVGNASTADRTEYLTMIGNRMIGNSAAVNAVYLAKVQDAFIKNNYFSGFTNEDIKNDDVTGKIEVSSDVTVDSDSNVRVLQQLYNHPAFRAELSSTQSDVTGDSTDYLIPYDTTLYDNDSNFDTTNHQFDVPVNGIYQFKCHFRLDDITSSHTKLQLKLSATGINHMLYLCNPYQISYNGVVVISTSTDLKLSAGDNVKIYLQVDNGTKAIDLIDASYKYQSFSGSLLLPT